MFGRIVVSIKSQTFEYLKTATYDFDYIILIEIVIQFALPTVLEQFGGGGRTRQTRFIFAIF